MKDDGKYSCKSPQSLHNITKSMDNPTTPPAHVFDSGAARYEASTGGCTYDLARSILSLLPPITSGSIIHDNACGPAIVARSVLTSLNHRFPLPTPDYTLTMHCTDKSTSMISLAESALQSTPSTPAKLPLFPHVTIHFASTPSENLSFPDNYFTHSITNCGILWFEDARIGAQEIHRTLRPGATVVVTSWKVLGQFDVVRQAQKACGYEELFRPPVDEKWFEARYLQDFLREVGFEDVRVLERTVHFAARNVQELCGHLIGLVGLLNRDSDGEAEREFGRQLEVAASKVVEKVERQCDDGKTEELVGISMVALVCIARKSS